jgi:nucleoid-associated protein YgaU
MYQGTNYTVQSGDKLDDIARRAYRLPNSATPAHQQAAQEIYNANADKLPDPKNPVPGTTLYIPTIKR